MKFKRGDIIAFDVTDTGSTGVFVLDYTYGKNSCCVMCGITGDGSLVFNDRRWGIYDTHRFASNTEKEALFNALAKENKYYCEKTKTIKEMKKKITKKDLKSGMWVKFRHGGTMLCLGMCTTPDKKEDIVFANATGFNVASMLNNNLICIKNDEFSIDEVYYHGYVKGDVLNGIANLPLIWQRQTDASKKEKIQAEIDKMQNAIDEVQKELNDLK